jgi:hypothetical protein
MSQRVASVVILAFVAVVLGFGQVRADDDHPAEAPGEAPAEEHHEAAAEDHHEAAAEDHHAGDPEHHEASARPSDDEDEVPYTKFDADGDGKADPELEKEYDEATGGMSDTIDTDAVDKALDARPEDAELKPSMTVEAFRKVVRVVKKVVLTRMENKMAKKSAQRMSQFSTGVFVFSLAGLLLLAIPLVGGKKYPGQTGVLMKYSALAAGTFFVTVNLFGGVLMAMKTAQGALGDLTNPSLAIAGGTFDTLDRNADEYIVMGKELFVPTLMQLQGNSDEQPSALILENGMKIVKDAKVFVSIAKMFKKIDFIFGILPIVLFALTMVLFGLAIRPTLTEIIKLPMRAASGQAGAGRDVTKRAMLRVWGELLATICTIGVLAALTLISAFILGQIVGPALDALLGYFALAVNYLQFVEGASSGTVFLALFGVILFLAFNLASLILSMSFFLGKSQKIFQQRFNEGVPVATHKRFFMWGIPAVLLVQVFPWLFVFVAQHILDKINESLVSGVTDADKVPWGKILLAGPLFLVVGYAVMFWAARGIKAIRFLQSYKVRPSQPPVSGSAETAEPVPS